MSMVVQKTPQIMVLLAAHNGTRWIAATTVAFGT